MSDYLTVVFKCDKDSKLRSSITEAFAGDGVFQDATITAVSREDEISRVEKLEAQVDELDTWD